MKLENQNSNLLASQLQQIINSKSEENLYEIIGNALYDSGLQISSLQYPEATIPITLNEDSTNFNILESIKFIEDTTAITKVEAIIRGKGLLKRIKTQLCTNETIKNFFTGDNKLTDNLKVIIPIILSLISSTLALGPVGLAIAVALIALLIKIGYEAYCAV